jgi:hypothetical protein
MYIEVFCRDIDRVREHVDALLGVYHQHGLTRSIYHIKIVDGWATAQRGEPPSPLSQQPDGPAELATTTRVNPFIVCLRAETLAARGDTAGALETVTGALETARRTNYVEYEAELVRLRGELLPADAEAAFAEALTIARQQQARSLELRAATSLATLWHTRGQQQPARDLLAGIYGWFTEGHETHDLKAAGKLLAELG